MTEVAKDTDCYMLSFPRSGSTLLRGFYEFLTEEPTHTAGSNSKPLMPSLYDKVNQEPRAYKTHSTDNIENCGSLLLIYRKPQECIFSHMIRGGGFGSLDPISGEWYVDMDKFNIENCKRIIEQYSNWFKDNLNFIFSKMDAKLPVKVISFNKLVQDPYNTTKEVISFFDKEIVGDEAWKDTPEKIAEVTRYCKTTYEWWYPPLTKKMKSKLELFRQTYNSDSMIIDLVGRDNIERIESFV